MSEEETIAVLIDAATAAIGYARGLETRAKSAEAEAAKAWSQVDALEAENAQLQRVLRTCLKAMGSAVVNIELGASLKFNEDTWEKIGGKRGNAAAWVYHDLCHAASEACAILDKKQEATDA